MRAARFRSGLAAAALALAATAGVSVLTAVPAGADIVIKVTNGNDSGPGSYRDAINIANTNGDTQPDVIEFDDVEVVLTSGDVAYTGTQPLRLTGEEGSSIDGSGAFQILAATAPVTIERLTLKHGSSSIGGAVNIAGPVTISNSRFVGNDADIGGAVNTIGPLTIWYSEFDRNTGLSGGAVNVIGNLTIAHSELTDNEGILGGAVVAITTGLTSISHSELTGNRAPLGVGGAVAVISTIDVSDSLFEDNSASVGGSIAFATNITVLAAAGAGTAELTPGSLRVGDVAVDADTSTADVSATATPNSGTLDGTTIADSDATQGGGVAAATDITVDHGVPGFVGPASLEAVNSTFTDNKASQAGGAMELPFGDVTLTYVTSSHNGAPNGAQVQAASLETFGTEYGTGIGGDNCDVEDTTSEGYNFSTDDSCDLDEAGDREDAGDPGLGELGDHGGATPTRVPLAASPLIDAIPVDACDDEDVHEDQREVARPQGDACDIGAVEVQLEPAVAIVIEPTFTG